MRKRERLSKMQLESTDRAVLEAVRRIAGGRPVGVRDVAHSGIGTMMRVSASLRRLTEARELMETSVGDRASRRTVYQHKDDFGPPPSDLPEWLTGPYVRPPYTNRLIHRGFSDGLEPLPTKKDRDE